MDFRDPSSEAYRAHLAGIWSHDEAKYRKVAGDVDIGLRSRRYHCHLGHANLVRHQIFDNISGEVGQNS
jgi:hypothetical protein